MTNEEQTSQPAIPAQPEVKSLGSPDLSFSEYETLRRGGTLTVTPAPSAPQAEKPAEQKKSLATEASETDEKEEAKDESEEEGDEPDSKEGLEKGKPKKSGYQRRIDKLNAAKSAAQQEAEYWKQKALAGATHDSKQQPNVEKKSAAADGKPNPENFDTHAEYVEALTDWKTEQKLMERDQKLERSRLEAEQANRLKSHWDRVESFKESHDDYTEMLENLEEVPRSAAIEEIIVSSENGPALLYELAKNPEEAKRIAKLSPLACAREMGKLEARLSAESEKPKAETKKTTQAPKPIAPVASGKVTTPKSLDDPNLSFAEFEKLRREQQRRRNA